MAVREMQAAEERTIEDAEKAYKMYLRTEKQNKPGSVEDTEYRLGMFFCEVDALAFGSTHEALIYFGRAYHPIRAA